MNQKIVNSLYYGASGFLLGILISIFMSFSVWVEMRINLANFMIAGLLIGLVAGYFTKKIYSFLFFLVELVIIFLSLVLNKVDFIVYLFKDLLIEFGPSAEMVSKWLPFSIIAVNVFVLLLLYAKRKLNRDSTR